MDLSGIFQEDSVVRELEPDGVRVKILDDSTGNKIADLFFEEIEDNLIVAVNFDINEEVDDHGSVQLDDDELSVVGSDADDEVYFQYLAQVAAAQVDPGGGDDLIRIANQPANGIFNALGIQFARDNFGVNKVKFEDGYSPLAAQRNANNGGGYRIAGAGSNRVQKTNKIDLKDTDGDINVEIGNLWQQGVKVVAVNGNNKIVDADNPNSGVKYITDFTSGSGSTTFTFTSEATTIPCDYLRITATTNIGNKVSTFDFSAIDKPLFFEFRPVGLNLNIKVSFADNADGSEQTQLASLTVANTDNFKIIGGKNNNNYRFLDSFFAGSIVGGADDQPEDKTNTLDFSKISVSPIVDIGLNTADIFTGTLVNGKSFSKIDAVEGGTLFKTGSVIIGSDSVEDEELTGSDGRDTITGGALGAIIKGLEENDVLTGGASSDDIQGNEGNDTITGNARNDLLLGGSGNDVIDGGAGNDTISGGKGNDTLQGGTGNDQIIVGSSSRLAKGLTGETKLAAYRSRVEGGIGNDTITGGDNDNLYIFDDGWGQDEIKEFKGKGDDTLDFRKVGSDLTHVLDNSSVKSGLSSGFTEREAITVASTLPRTVTFQPADGTFTQDFVEASYIEGIATGTGENIFRFGDDWQGDIQIYNMDADGSVRAEKLILDFRGVSQPLYFDFKKDGSLEISVRIFNFYWPTKSIKIDKIDEDTIIYGGRFENQFVAAPELDEKGYGSAQFAGTIIGGGGYYDPDNPDATISATELVQQSAKVLSLAGGLGSFLNKIFKTSIPAGQFGLAGVPVTNTLSFDGGLQFWPPTAFSSSIAAAFQAQSINLQPLTGTTQTVTGLPKSFTGEIRFVDNVTYSGGSYIAQGTGIGAINASGNLVGLSLTGSNIFEPVTSLQPRPGVSIFAGGTGGDIYRYANLWGLSLIAESPDVQIAGENAEVFYDVLDLTSVSDIVIDIAEFSSVEILEELFGESEYIPDPDTFDIGSNLILAEGQNPLPAWVTGLIEAGGETLPDLPSSLLAAIDIETIVAANDTTIRFSPGGKLDGAVRPFSLDFTAIAELLSGSGIFALYNYLTKSSQVTLDYTNYGSGVSVDADAGADISYLEEIPILGRTLTFGTATGVEGNFSGLDALLPDELLEQLGDLNPRNFAVSNIYDVLGSSGDDTLSGSSVDNRFEGLAGNDSLVGEEGNDTLIGGLGDDTLMGGAGDDSLVGGLGNDSIEGGTGNDVITIEAININDDEIDQITVDGGDGSDDSLDLSVLSDDYTIRDITVDGETIITLSVEDNGTQIATITYSNIEELIGTITTELSGTAGDDTLTGGSRNDTINSVGGNDVITSQAGNDTITISTVNDDNTITVDSGSDDDTITISAINDGDIITIDGGSGNDTLDLTQLDGRYVINDDGNGEITFSILDWQEGTISATTTIIEYSNIETINSFAYNGAITGTTAAESLTGTDQNDLINGNGGSDTISGGAGNDIIVVSTLDGTVLTDGGLEVDPVGSIDITIYGATGIDILDLSVLSSFYTLTLTESGDNGEAGVFVVEDNGTEIGSITFSGIEQLIREEALNTNAVSSDNNPESLTLTQIDPLITEALSRWSEAGYNVNIPTNLSAVQWAIADLPGTMIGKTDGQTITLDSTAGGIGWFIDQTPEDDSEFTFNGEVYLATEEGGATGKLDLLTTILHEFGHILGLEDISESNTLMSQGLLTGTRLNPETATIETVLLGAPVVGSIIGATADTDLFNTGFSQFATWAENFTNTLDDIVLDINNNAIALPFFDASVQDAFDITTTDISNTINSWAENITNYLANNDLTTLDSLAGISAVNSADDIQFSTSIDLLDYSEILDVDFVNTSLGDLGLNFGKKAAPTLELLSDLTLNFIFGKDNNGNFFVRNPQLQAELSLDSTAIIDPNSISSDQGGSFTITENGLLYTPATDFQGTETVTYDIVQVDADGNFINRRSFSETLTVGPDFSGVDVVNGGLNDLDLGDYIFDSNSSDNLIAILENPLYFNVNFGPIGINVKEGDIRYETGATAEVTGRLSVADLTNDTTGNLISETTLNNDGNYEVTLPISIDTPFAGIDLDIPGFIGTFNIGNEPTNVDEFLEQVDPFNIGIDDLLPFQNISLSQECECMERH